MRTADFDYDLPPALIAQRPATQRDAARLLLLERGSGRRQDQVFGQLPALLPPGALLVMNDSRVFPARLHGHKPTGGAVEVLLVRQMSPAPETWICLCRSSKGVKVGQTIVFEAPGQGTVTARVEDLLGAGNTALSFTPVDASRTEPQWFSRWVDAVGEIPLPPYIERPDGEHADDRERYQTVYAEPRGSVAAPTAGLHFTPALLAALEDAGVERACLTLHVGPGTFRPVRGDDADAHHMDAEAIIVSDQLAAAVANAKAAGRPVIAVGTTTVRALEGAAVGPGELEPGRRDVSLFIRPGHQFQVVDGLITNFHLPRSTLLMLVSALAGREAILDAYQHAVAEGYRFYSYGDAMFVRPEEA